MGETLFTRLSSYSQNPAKQSLENFTTEVLVHLINNDKAFRKIFIRHVINDGRILRRFRYASAESQQSFGNGIVDIVLSSRDSKILIEIKITAAETETKIYGKGRVSQIQKYLNFRVGRVAYLTTKAVSAPNLKFKNRRFLGQSYFENLYDHLVKAKPKLTDCGRLFLQFMEENDMKSPEPFTQHELTKPENFFSFAEKCEDLLNEIRSEVQSDFRKLFSSRTQFTSGHFSPTYKSAYIYTKGGLSGYSKIKAVGIALWPADNKLEYGVFVRIPQTDIKKLERHLKWEQEKGGLYSSRQVMAGIATRKIVKTILNDLKILKRALNRIY